MQAKKLAAQVAELRALPDNKRCWDCEQLVRVLVGLAVLWNSTTAITCPSCYFSDLWTVLSKIVEALCVCCHLLCRAPPITYPSSASLSAHPAAVSSEYNNHACCYHCLEWTAASPARSYLLA
jgi:hypothetical protein